MTYATSVLSNIARVDMALQAGRLNSYAPSKSLFSADAKSQRSWGPAMRR